MDAGLEVVKYRTGGWSRRLAIINVVLGVLSAASIVYRGDLLGLPRVPAMPRGRRPTLNPIVAALGIWVWNSVDGWRKARSEQSQIPSAGAPVTYP